MPSTNPSHQASLSEFIADDAGFTLAVLATAERVCLSGSCVPLTPFVSAVHMYRIAALHDRRRLAAAASATLDNVAAGPTSDHNLTDVVVSIIARDIAVYIGRDEPSDVKDLVAKLDTAVRLYRNRPATLTESLYLTRAQETMSPQFEVDTPSKPFLPLTLKPAVRCKPLFSAINLSVAEYAAQRVEFPAFTRGRDAVRDVALADYFAGHDQIEFSYTGQTSLRTLNDALVEGATQVLGTNAVIADDVAVSREQSIRPVGWLNLRGQSVSDDALLTTSGARHLIDRVSEYIAPYMHIQGTNQ